MFCLQINARADRTMNEKFQYSNIDISSLLYGLASAFICEQNTNIFDIPYEFTDCCIEDLR